MGTPPSEAAAEEDGGAGGTSLPQQAKSAYPLYTEVSSALVCNTPSRLTAQWIPYSDQNPVLPPAFSPPLFPIFIWNKDINPLLKMEMFFSNIWQGMIYLEQNFPRHVVVSHHPDVGSLINYSSDMKRFLHTQYLWMCVSMRSFYNSTIWGTDPHLVRKL